MPRKWGLNIVGGLSSQWPCGGRVPLVLILLIPFINSKQFLYSGIGRQVMEKPDSSISSTSLVSTSSSSTTPGASSTMMGRILAKQEERKVDDGRERDI
jgi:hypothetical protein